MSPNGDIGVRGEARGELLDLNRRVGDIGLAELGGDAKGDELSGCSEVRNRSEGRSILSTG